VTHDDFLHFYAKHSVDAGEERAQAEAALAPYRVKNAVLMAAGSGSRLAPITARTPKGLLRIRGEVLVERQIQQLISAGIAEIFLIVGYRKEQFSYLASNPYIHIVENPDYCRYNNTSSLYRVLDVLDNTYICSADNYFTENVFTPYVYRSYYASVYGDEPTTEYYLTVDADERITDVQIGGQCGWYMMGQAYFSRAFSEKFRTLLRSEYGINSFVPQMLWEQFYMRHLDELILYRKRCPSDIIYEFDTLADILAFDPNFHC
jgi:cholinephosphate cytidylyltransferase/choline kinase